MEARKVTQQYVKQPQKQTDRTGCIWNFLSILVVLGMGLVAGFFVFLYLNPSTPLNPFPPQMAQPAPIASPSPADLPTELSILPSVTPTLKEFPPTWTVTASLLPTMTFTPKPVTPTSTPVVLVTAGPTDTSTPTAKSPTKAPLPFVLQGTPVGVSSTIMHPDSGCKWFGVGGQVFDLKGSPIVGYTIQLGGTLGDAKLDLLSLTGTALQYGPAGYEFVISDKPANSKKTLWIQLLDQAGLPLSSRITFDTFEDCQKNLILVNLRQVK